MPTQSCFTSVWQRVWTAGWFCRKWTSWVSELQGGWDFLLKYSWQPCGACSLNLRTHAEQRTASRVDKANLSPHTHSSYVNEYKRHKLWRNRANIYSRCFQNIYVCLVYVHWDGLACQRRVHVYFLFHVYMFTLYMFSCVYVYSGCVCLFWKLPARRCTLSGLWVTVWSFFIRFGAEKPGVISSLMLLQPKKK